MSNIKKVTKMAGSKFLTLYSIDYQNRVGDIKNWNSASRLDDVEKYKNRLINKNCGIDAVLIVAYHIEEEKLVLVKQYRVPLNDYIYEIPAGLVDDNEDIRLCAKRELLEETGLNLVDITKVIENIYISPGMSDECSSMIFCTCNGNISDKFLQDDEELTIHLLDKSEVKSIIDNNEKIDMKTLFAMQMYCSLGKDAWY